MPRVIRIEPTVDIRTHTSISNIKKRRVCAYARVSTNSDEQETSYEAQVDYYRKYIQAHNEWEYVGVYADEGVTGTSTKRRNGFKEMMNDALDHKIDLILAKSVSRFARNTVDTLTNIRMLKDNGVEVYFEKENIWTFDSKGEVLLTIMSSLAQEVRNPHLQSFVINGWGADFGDPVNFLGQETYGDDNAYYAQYYSNANLATDEKLIAAYKEFSALVNEAKVINDLDARYAAFAKAEACMLDHCLVVPAYVNVGWTLTKVNPYSQIYCAYGMMTYRYVNYDTNSDGYTTAEIEELKAAYNAN